MPRGGKIVLIGDVSVGKTNFFTRLTEDKYSDRAKATIGPGSAFKTITVGKETVKAEIWDTAGQERYRGLTNAFFRDAAAAIVCVDLTNDLEADGSKSKIIRNLHDARRLDPNLPVLILGTKSDAVDASKLDGKVAKLKEIVDEKKTSSEGASMNAMSCSAKNNVNVEAALQAVCLLAQAAGTLEASAAEDVFPLTGGPGKKVEVTTSSPSCCM